MGTPALSTNSNDLLTLVLVVVLSVPLFMAVYRRREAILRTILRVVVFCLFTSVVFLYYSQRQVSTPINNLLLGAGFGVLTSMLIPGRKRYIPTSERRKAIAQYESKTGKKFNRRIHELDHQIPFSKGGSSTADNLRVVHRTVNRRKGDKSPWWDVLSSK